MTSLKCWNSGVNSNGAAFILSPSVSGFVSRVPGAYGKEASSSNLTRLASQLFVSDPTSDNLFHDASEALRIRVMPVVISKRLLIDVPSKMKRFDADIGSVQAALQEDSRSSPSCSYGRYHSRTLRRG